MVNELNHRQILGEKREGLGEHILQEGKQDDEYVTYLMKIDQCVKMQASNKWDQDSSTGSTANWLCNLEYVFHGSRTPFPNTFYVK